MANTMPQTSTKEYLAQCLHQALFSLPTSTLEEAIKTGGHMDAKRILYLHIADWVPQLTTTEMKFGGHLLYGHGCRVKVKWNKGHAQQQQLVHSSGLRQDLQ